MHFQTAHLNPEFQYNVKIDDLSLEQKYSTKFLGVIIDKNLSWNQHLSSIKIIFANSKRNRNLIQN